MLRSVYSMSGFTVQATDKAIGTVREFLFDANAWEIRYMVFDPDHQIAGRNVVIAPVAFGKPVWEARQFPVLLTQDQVRTGPDKECEQRKTAHLHSTQEVMGCRVQALDGEIGCVEDLIVDDDVWGIAYIIVKIEQWQPEREVLIAPDWITEVQWHKKTMSVDLSGERIKYSPEYNPADPVNREYEIQLYDFYGRPRPKNWTDFASTPDIPSSKWNGSEKDAGKRDEA